MQAKRIIRSQKEEAGVELGGRRIPPIPASAISLLALALITLFHVINNLRWLSTNVVTMGWDRNDHLVRTLSYHNILTQITPASLFKALTWSDYYPPLVHLVVVAAYKFFGVATDVAAMTNVLYLVLLLLGVYAIGRRLGGETTGLLAALLVSLFPMIFAFSRYLYLDFALTGWVAASVALLLYAERFRRRRLSWLFGLSVGLGLLTKWTFVAFVAAPALWIVWRGGVWRAILRALRTAPARWHRFAWALLAGAILAGAWLLPNAARVQTLTLGWLLLPLFAFLFAMLFFFLTGPDDPGWNALGAGATGLVVSGLWYFTKLNFIQTALVVAYGKPTGRRWGFGRYLRYLWTEELSPIFVLLFIFALLLLIRYAATHRDRVWQLWRERDEPWLLLLWLVVPYVIFSWQASTIHARYILPMMPAIGLAIAAGLMTIPSPRLRGSITLLVVIVSLIQFAALTFDGLGPLRQAALINLPGGRSINWFANDFQNQLPASGPTDPGYWIVPDVLDRTETWRREHGQEQADLAIIINDAQVHEKHFLYQIYTGHRQVRLRELARNWSGRPAYPQLFEADLVLLEDRPHPRNVAQESQQTIRRILAGPDDLFHRIFRLNHRYTMPDGEKVYLYERVVARPNVDVTYYQALLQDLAGLWREGDALLISPMPDLNVLGQLGAADLAPVALPADADLSYLVIDDLYGKQKRLILVQRDNAAAATEAWLDRIAYRAYDRWYGNLHLIVYATGPTRLSHPVPIDAQFGPDIHLTGYGLNPDDVRAGGTLRLTLTWRASRPVSQRLKVFAHLVDGAGQLVAQRDSEPRGGTLPTTSWRPGQDITDRLAVILPSELPAGPISLVVGLYDPATGRRLPVTTSSGQGMDHLQLTTFTLTNGG